MKLFATSREVATVRSLSFDTLKKKVEPLADDDWRKLLAYMVTLEDRGLDDYREKLARKIDDVSLPNNESAATGVSCLTQRHEFQASF